MKHTLKEKYFLVTSVLSVGVIVLLYPNIIINPGSLLLDDTGDALKNYYVYLYHILHDESPLDFLGMNYPYGEFLLYTDSQPLLSSLLRALGANISSSLACMHLCIFMSLAAIGPLFYLILRKFDVIPVVAAIVSLIAVMLNPQAIRIGGHFALAWSCFIPLAWLVTIAFLQKSRFSLLVILSATLLIAYFIHPYLGVLASGISFCWAIMKSAQVGSLYKFLSIASAIAIPLLLFQSIGWIFDDHENRTSWPYGFYEYNADVAGALLPHHGPLGKYILKNKLNLRWEGWAYAGLGISILYILLLFRFVRFLAASRNKIVLTDQDRLLIIASIFLTISTALPFMGPFDRLYEWFPPLRQFRAIGRFSWIWWYAMLTLGGIIFSLYWTSRPKFRPWLLLLASLTALEGFWQHRELFVKVGKPVCFKDPSSNSDNSEFFQAILPLPFFHMGSDNSTIDGQEEMIKKVFVESMATGLPFVGADESRISWSEARESIRLFSAIPGSEKPILRLFDKRPLKVLAIPDKMSHRDSIFFESFVLESNGELYCIPDSLGSSSRGHLYADSNDIPVWPEFHSSCENSVLIIENFESDVTAHALTGKGSFEGQKEDHKQLLSIPPGKLSPGITYELSYWVWSGGEDQVNEMMIVEEYNPEINWKEWKEVGSVNRSSDFYGDWTLGKLEFTIENLNSRITIMSRGSKGNRSIGWIDQLMIREKECNVYSLDISGKIVYLNNLPLRSQTGQQ